MVGGTVLSGDLDIQALQAKLAAQEARLNDLQAKIGGGSGGSAANVTSIRKNAKVTIGGQINTRYLFHNVRATDGATGEKETLAKGADFKVSQARVNVKVDVNDYFDAFLQLDLQDGKRASTYSQNDDISTARFAWIRWKNLCNSGFGILIGRDSRVFGAGNQGGAIATGWAGSNDWLTGGDNGKYGFGAGWRGDANWDCSRTTQITPYWESQDGKIKAEVSFFQGTDTFDGGYFYTADESRRSRNWGPTNVSARFTVKPIEGLRLVASVLRETAIYGGLNANNTSLPITAYGPPIVYGTRDDYNSTKSHTAVNVGADYSPACFKKLKVFAQWVHDWNTGLVKSADLDVITAGLTFAFNEQVTAVLQGDLLWGDDNVVFDGANKPRGWAVYPALQYKLPYGVMFEIGWRHEYVKFKSNDDKAKSDTIYGHVGFDF